MGQFTLRGIPIDQDGLRIQIIQNEILPANLRGNLMWRKFYEFPMGSSYQFRAPDFSRENNFLIYPPGKVIGKIKLGDKLETLAAGQSIAELCMLLVGPNDPQPEILQTVLIHLERLQKTKIERSINAICKTN